MVKYPNAASGIKKVFLAKIIGVIGVPLAFIPGIGALLLMTCTVAATIFNVWGILEASKKTSCTAFAVQLSNRLEICVKAEILSALIEIDQIYHRRIDSYNKHHQCCKCGENVLYRINATTRHTAMTIRQVLFTFHTWSPLFASP